MKIKRLKSAHGVRIISRLAQSPPSWAEVIPAGVAWQRVLEQPRHPVPHDRDGSHPTLAGSYLAACCAFADRFTAAGKPFKVVVTAAMRKLLIILNVIVKTNPPCRSPCVAQIA